MSYSVNTISAESTAVISRQAVSEQQLQANRVRAGTVQENGNKVEDSSAITATFGTSADKIEISPEGRKALEQIYAAKAAKANTRAAEATASTQAAPKASALEPSEALTTKPGPERTQEVKPVEADSLKADKNIAKTVDEAPEATREAKPRVIVEEKAEKPAAEKPRVQVKEEATELKLELPGTGTQEAVTTETESVSSPEIQNMSVSELRSAVTEGTITAAQMDDELSRRKAAEQQSEQKAAEAQEAMNEALNSLKNMNKAAENMSTFSTVKQYAAVAQALA